MSSPVQIRTLNRSSRVRVNVTGRATPVILSDTQGVTVDLDDALVRQSLGHHSAIGQYVIQPDLQIAQVAEPTGNVATDTANINSAIALAALNGGGGVVMLGAGTYVTRGGHTDGGGCVEIRGQGENRTTVRVSSSAPAGVDIFTLNHTNSAVTNMTIDGNRISIASGDAIVLNAAYCIVEHAGIYNAGGNAITLGKAAAAAQCRLHDLRIRDALGYGIQTVTVSGTFDNQWSYIDVGRSGKSGIRLDSGSQLLENVHSWGNGIYSDLTGTDSAGFFLNSASNTLTNCEGETNNSYGVNNKGLSNSITGGMYWGNNLNGIFSFGGDRLAMTGVRVYRNAVTNSAGSGSAAFANFQNQSKYLTMSGCNFWDDNTVAIAAGSYAPYTPPFPFPGRAAIYTVAKHYHEVSPADSSTIIGNTMRQEDTRSGVAYLLSGTNSTFRHNDVGAGTANVSTVASAGTLTLPSDAGTGICKVSGTTGITAITAKPPGFAVTLVFTGALTVTSGNNIFLNNAAGNLTTAADTSLALVCDGTNWYETARSINR